MNNSRPRAPATPGRAVCRGASSIGLRRGAARDRALVAAEQRQDWTLGMEREVAAADHILIAPSPPTRTERAQTRTRRWGAASSMRLD
jgi:hypothetical protein